MKSGLESDVRLVREVATQAAFAHSGHSCLRPACSRQRDRLKGQVGPNVHVLPQRSGR